MTYPENLPNGILSQHPLPPQRHLDDKPAAEPPLPTATSVTAKCVQCDREFLHRKSQPRDRCRKCQTSHGIRRAGMLGKVRAKRVAPDALDGESLSDYLDRVDREKNWNLP